RRETWLKVTGGQLCPRQLLQGEYPPSRLPGTGEGSEYWEEKAHRVILPSGAGETQLSVADAGTICVVTGLHDTFAGGGLGYERGSTAWYLEPVLTYALHLPEGCDVYQTYRRLGQLEEEIPELHLSWQESLQEIHARMMGEVQIEVLEQLIGQRFGLQVSFGEGKILYKETILSPCEGVGHFEPLRHYAEVHLILEPGERGSGLVFGSSVSTDDLKENWQRLILTHLREKTHAGVLTGSPITDMKITLSAGRAHLKHTEGGDFRQATYRAIRQGLMRARCELLEPFYDYLLELPRSCVGKAMHDLQRMNASIEGPLEQGDSCLLRGRGPVSTMWQYQTQVLSYTGGQGRLSCTLAGYYPCHNQEEVIAERAYDPEADTENPADSVFCSHGAGRVVPWNEVEAHMHLEATLSPGTDPMKQG
ncbi:MAG: TetM/TetW/TetO/TetS family tetracycline resistance ribosomal protection protein, partial [Lachnospiraceae bacterium]|nr:TetM/TetW/TetO/TetS family tetracycline resistance ribosomal protection protein [Lachnospiraceae bacterium]